jgi:hypothetical protein
MLRYTFKNNQVPKDISDNEIFIVSTMLVITGIDEITDESIPVIMKRFRIAEAFDGGSFNVKESDYYNMVKKCNGLKANVTTLNFKQFVRKLSDSAYLNSVEIPKKKKTREPCEVVALGV